VHQLTGEYADQWEQEEAATNNGGQQEERTVGSRL